MNTTSTTKLVQCFTVNKKIGDTITIERKLISSFQNSQRRKLEPNEFILVSRSVQRHAIGLIGWGVVGGGVVEILSRDRRLFTANLRDISERKDTEIQQSALIYHDPVTGLPNRLWLLRTLGDGLARKRAMVWACWSSRRPKPSRSGADCALKPSQSWPH